MECLLAGQHARERVVGPATLGVAEKSLATESSSSVLSSGPGGEPEGLGKSGPGVALADRSAVQELLYTSNPSLEPALQWAYGPRCGAKGPVWCPAAVGRVRDGSGTAQGGVDARWYDRVVFFLY